MHTLIHILVEASDQSEALEAGEDALDVLTGEMEEPAVFDDFRMFSSNKGREDAVDEWGDLPPAVPLASTEGQQLLDRGWTETEEEFHRNLEIVRAAFDELSDEEIMRDVHDVRLAFYRLGILEGPPIHLYDRFGYGIRSQEQLDKILDEYEDTWIVPGGVIR